MTSPSGSADSSFDSKLLVDKNPFRFPEPPRRPPFMVGGEEYLRWFKESLNQSAKQGYVLSYIVGQPGSGKSHFLNHLDYLFNERKEFPGIYSVYRAKRQRFTDADLWRHFFSYPDVGSEIRRILTESGEPESGDSRELLDLMKKSGSLSSPISDNLVHNQVRLAGELLGSRGIPLCLAIDNVDEYFRYLSAGLSNEKALDDLLGTVRSAVTEIDHAMIMLCCTTDVYRTIEQTTVDPTHLRRTVRQNKVLRELSLSQSLELVNEYMKWWAATRSLHIPAPQECSTTEGHGINVYPFTEKAIRYFYEKTNHYAGELVSVCGETIEGQRARGRISIVQDEDLIDAIDRAVKNRWIFITPPDLEVDRSLILDKKLAQRFDEIIAEARAKFKHSIDPNDFFNGIERVAEVLGISIAPINAVRNTENPQKWVRPNRNLRIWSSGGKKAAAKYILGRGSMSGLEYLDKITYDDISEVVSLIGTGQATHGIFIIGRASSTPEGVYSEAHRLKIKYESIVDFRQLSEDDVLFLLNVASLSGKDQKDVIDYVDRFRLQLSDGLKFLFERDMSTYREREAEREREERRSRNAF